VEVEEEEEVEVEVEVEVEMVMMERSRCYVAAQLTLSIIVSVPTSRRPISFGDIPYLHNRNARLKKRQ